MTGAEMSPSEEAKFDHLVETGQFSAGEARQRATQDRREILGDRATDLVISAANKRKSHNSRRGGRSYPEPSDSELDPFWNGAVSAGQVISSPEADAAFSQLLEDARAAAIKSIADRENVPMHIAKTLYNVRYRKK